ncbi:MAG TPA: peptidase S1, partial [Ktedonobacter sp.]|nr:peptidase S1 [Ktedonobacter sp.]
MAQPYDDQAIPYESTQGTAYANTNADASDASAEPSRPTEITEPHEVYRPASSPDYRQPPQQPPRRPRNGLRTGAILALALLLALVFGTGLFAGWQFGHGSAAVADPSNTGQLQPGTRAAATVPALSGNNIETVREAVIAKVRPAVVQVNVTTQGGGGLGSGVIIDKRGYIVTNNHVVNGAQSIEVVLYDGTSIKNV